MKDKVFIDTNILIYLYSEDDIEKQQSFCLTSNCIETTSV